MVAPQLLSSARTTGSDKHCTPPDILDRVRKVGPIGLDPFANEGNNVGARVFYTEADDAFKQADPDEVLQPGEIIFANPPYSIMPRVSGLLMHYAAAWPDGLITLCKSATETQWFQKLGWQTSQAVCFPKGRLHFYDSATGKPVLCWSKVKSEWISAQATFPSALIYHGPKPWAFEEAFSDLGKVVRL